MSESKHTPGKLEKGSIKGWELWIGVDHHIADVHGQLDKRRANAERLVKCWNSHDDLLKACEAVQVGLCHILQRDKPDWLKQVDDAISKAEKG